MCLQCVLLGALVNAGVDASADDDGDPSPPSSSANVRDRFRTESLSPYDFAPPARDVEHILDRSARSHLRRTLTLFRTATGHDLVPLRVEDDGSCLPHAVSRCLVGHEVYYDALRLDLREELRSHPDWYGRVLNVDADGNRVYDDEEWRTREWPRILGASEPTYGERAGPERWLGPEHVLAFANVLGRPVLLLNSPEMMADPHEGNRGGLFLPLRRTREEIVRMHGATFPGPIVVGYSGPEANHYVALVRVRPTEAELRWGRREALASDAYEPLRDFLARHFWSEAATDEMRIELRDELLVSASSLPPARFGGAAGGGGSPGDGRDLAAVRHPRTRRTVIALAPPGRRGGGGEGGGEIAVGGILPLWAIELEAGLTALATRCGPSVRSRAIRILRLYIKNALKAREDAAYGRMDGLRRVGTIPLGRGAACRWIADVPGAVSVLAACGYRLVGGRDDGVDGDDDDDDDDGGGGGERCMRLGRAPLCAYLESSPPPDDDGTNEDGLRRLEGLSAQSASADDAHVLRRVISLLDELGRISLPPPASSCGGRCELPGGTDDETALMGPVPRYSWLGVGPPAVVDPKTGKVRIPAWPPASSPASPSFSSSALWDAARSHYGSGLAARPDGAWEFGSGAGSDGFCRRRMVELEARFFTLTMGAFGTVRRAAGRIKLEEAAAVVVVTCPVCLADCVPSVPPGLLSEECLASCPRCGSLLDLGATYRNRVADAVAEAARGSLGGVWSCDGPAPPPGGEPLELMSDEDVVSLMFGGAVSGAGTGGGGGGGGRRCGALNVGHSPRCVRCGGANPDYRTAKRAKRAAGSGGGEEGRTAAEAAAAEADANPRADMMRILTEMLSAAAGGAPAEGRARSRSSSIKELGIAAPGSGEEGGRPLGGEREERERERIVAETSLDFQFVRTFGGSPSDEDEDEEIMEKMAIQMSLQTEATAAPSDGEPQMMPPRPRAAQRGRLASCPVTLSLRPAETGGAPPRRALRMIAERADAGSGRETSAPVTEAERRLRARRSGLDLGSLTRSAALELLKSQGGGVASWQNTLAAEN